MTRLTIDRIESDRAVLEWDGGVVELPRDLLPPGATEGAVLQLEIRLDSAASEEDRRRVADRRARLSADDDGGDFSL